MDKNFAVDSWREGAPSWDDINNKLYLTILLLESCALKSTLPCLNNKKLEG
jgi:hypothetical protein